MVPCQCVHLSQQRDSGVLEQNSLGNLRLKVVVRNAPFDEGGTEMPQELLAVIIGGLIGILGSLSATVLSTIVSNRRSRNSIKAITAAEIVAMQEKAQRFLDGISDAEQLRASQPMLISIATQIGHLSPKEAVAYRRAVTLDVELRKSASEEKAIQTVRACEEAISLLNVSV